MDEPEGVSLFARIGSQHAGISRPESEIVEGERVPEKVDVTFWYHLSGDALVHVTTRPWKVYCFALWLPSMIYRVWLCGWQFTVAFCDAKELVKVLWLCQTLLQSSMVWYRWWVTLCVRRIRRGSIDALARSRLFKVLPLVVVVGLLASVTDSVLQAKLPSIYQSYGTWTQVLSAPVADTLPSFSVIVLVIVFNHDCRSLQVDVESRLSQGPRAYSEAENCVSEIEKRWSSSVLINSIFTTAYIGVLIGEMYIDGAGITGKPELYWFGELRAALKLLSASAYLLLPLLPLAGFNGFIDELHRHTSNNDIFRLMAQKPLYINCGRFALRMQGYKTMVGSLAVSVVPKIMMGLIAFRQGT